MLRRELLGEVPHRRIHLQRHSCLGFLVQPLTDGTVLDLLDGDPQRFVLHGAGAQRVVASVLHTIHNGLHREVLPGLVEEHGLQVLRYVERDRDRVLRFGLHIGNGEGMKLDGHEIRVSG